MAPATHVWVGPAVGGVWSNNANWDTGAPAVGETAPVIVQFNGGIDSTDDIAGLTINELHFTADGDIVRGAAGVTLGISGTAVTNSLVNDAGVNSVDASLPLDLQGATVSALVTAGQVFIDSGISGNQDLRLAAGSAAGILQLDGSTANTYTGTTFVNDGLLILAKDAGVTAIAGGLTVGDGIGFDEVDLGANDQIPDTTVPVINSSGFLNLAGNSDTIAGLTMTGGVVDSSFGTLGVTGLITATSDNSGLSAQIFGNLALSGAAGTFNVADGPVAGAVDLVVGATITGSVDLVKNGAGQMILAPANAPNAYTGSTGVNAGTLLNGAVDAIPVGSDLTVAGGATYNLDGFDQHVASLAGGGAVTNSNVNIPATLTVNTTATTTFSGVLSGNLSFVKDGPGTLTFAGTLANTYLGTTTVNDGVLILDKTPGVNAVPSGPNDPDVIIGDGIGAFHSAELRLNANDQIDDAATILIIPPDGFLNFNGHTDTVGGISPADLAVTKTAPVSVTAGSNLTYTISVTNSGPGDSLSVQLTDATPANTTFVSFSAPAGWTVTNTPPPGGTGSVTATNPDVAAGAPADVFTLVVQVNADTANASTIDNTVNVTSTTSDNDLTNNTSSTSTPVGTSADLALTKTGPATATAGTNVTYTLSLTNAGPSDAQGVNLTDTLPAGTTFVSASEGSGAGTSFTDPIGTLAAGASRTVTIVTQISAAVANNTVLTDSATATSTTTDSDSSNNTATFDTTVGASADLSLAKTGPATATAGTNITYTLSLTSAGPSDAQGVTLSDTLPAGATFVSASEGTGAGTAFTDNIGTFAAGASRTVTIVAHIGSGVANNSVITDTATVTSTTADSDNTNNTATFDTTINASADVGLSKTGPATAFAGGQVTFTLSLTNVGPSDAQGVVLTDTLPAGTTFVSASEGTGAGTSFTDTIGTLAASASRTVTLVAQIAAATANNAVLTDSATVTSTTADAVTGNNTATFDTTVNHPDVILSGPPTAVPFTTYTLSLSYVGSGITDVTINWGDGSSDTLPGTPPTATHVFAATCDAPSLTITASVTAGGNTFPSSTPLTVTPRFATPAERYFGELFCDVLGRAIDQAALNSAIGLLNGGSTRLQIALGIMTDPAHEFFTHTVQGLYQTLLHRPADPVGLRGNVNFLASGGTIDQVKASLLGSNEYFATRGGGTTAGFTVALYQDVLHRPPDTAAALAAQSFLAAGGSRSALALLLLRSREADAVVVNDLFLTLLNRLPDAASRNQAVNQLQAGLRDEQMEAFIAASDEYFATVSQ